MAPRPPFPLPCVVLATLLLLLVAGPRGARAAHPLGVDDPGTLEPGASEIEIGLGRADTGGARSAEANVAFRHGLRPGLDVGVALGAVEAAGAPGEAGLAFDLKLARPGAEGLRPALFVRADVGWETTARARPRWEGLGVGAAWSVAGAQLLLACDGIVAHPGAPRAQDLGWGLAALRPLGSRWCVAAEYGAPFSSAVEERARLQFGFGFALGDAAIWSFGHAIERDEHGAWSRSHWSVAVTHAFDPRSR